MMSAELPSRRQLVQTVEDLPTDLLPEVASFLAYLRFRAGSSIADTEENGQRDDSSSAFLNAITGLGASTEGDISTRDEEILANEIDPIRGWTHSEESQS